MGRLLRIPFLVDLVRTSDPAEVRSFAQDQRLDRNFTGRGPLLNRILTRKVSSVLALDGVPLPSVAPRGDAERARAQAELGTQLDAAAAGAFDDDSVTGLAKAVRGLKDAPILEHAVQQAVGRLFATDYRATRESWAAAQLLDKAAHSMNPLAAILWRVNGQITHAQRLLAEKVHNDRSGVHATGIAIHNLVRGFATMRDLLAAGDPGTRDTVVARCLKAPESVLRETLPILPDAADTMRPGTLVVLDLNAAQQHDPAPEVIFMTGSWSQCPAAAWVPALIGAVWQRAQHLPRPLPEPVGGPFRLEFTRAEAARRRAIYRGLLGCNLVLQFALGVVMIAAPTWVFHSLAMPPAAADFLRVWGLMLVLLAALYASGWFDPIYTRWPNVVGIVGRCAAALLYLSLGRGFLWFALFDAVFAGGLVWAYSQAIRAELMTRP
jgi:hypothetical protein